MRLRLAILDFNAIFDLKNDSCFNELEVVLCKKGRTFAYFSKALSTKHLKLSIYEKKYMVILMAIEIYKHYNKSLKLLLEQMILTPT